MKEFLRGVACGVMALLFFLPLNLAINLGLLTFRFAVTALRIIASITLTELRLAFTNYSLKPPVEPTSQTRH